MAGDDGLSRRRFLGGVGAVAAGWLAARAAAGEPAAPRVVAEAEEEVYRFTPADNGAGPMWCHGSTSLVRVGDDVFASGLETLPGVKPLNNCRWVLFHRGQDGWRRVRADETGRTREPCPLAAFADGRLFLSVNPTLLGDKQAGGGPARPGVWQFQARDPAAPPVAVDPVWDGMPAFSEHSYRSLAADAARGELILFQNIDYTHAEWSFRDRDGRWSSRGRLPWPKGTVASAEQPVRVCYPNVMLRDRAVHFCGVSDVVEPNAAWRAYKRKLTGQEWDYDFRRLFYTWTPDVTREPFRPWVEVASREKTAGWITPGDLWLGPDGRVQVVWAERALDERLRREFFPGEAQEQALGHAVLQGGRVVSKGTLVRSREGEASEVPAWPRVQVTGDGKVYLVYFVSGRDSEGRPLAENRLREVGADGRMGPAVRVPLARPLSSYFTATPRAGSAVGRTLDLLGTPVSGRQAISYARVRILEA